MTGQRGEKNNNKVETVVVAIDKDKGSQAALKWAVDNLLGKGKSVTLLHVKLKTSAPVPLGNHVGADSQSKEFFLPFRCFCTRKDIQVNEVTLEDADVAKALCDYVRSNFIETLVVGSSAKNGLVSRFKTVDISGSVTKGVPDFCTVYVISKGKVASVKSVGTPLTNEGSRTQHNASNHPTSGPTADARSGQMRGPFAAKTIPIEEMDTIKSPFTRGKTANRSYGELTVADSDISFVSPARPGNERMNSLFDQDMMMAPRLSNSSDTDNRSSFGSQFSNARSSDANNSFGVYSSSSQESGNVPWCGSQSLEDVEAEMRRLKQELKQTMDMYSTACKEALTAKQKALELHRWKVEEQQKLEEARMAEEAALLIAEKEKEKCRIAIEKAAEAQRLAELEARKRISAEMKAVKEAEEKRRVLDRLANNDVRYRKYSIEEVETATEYFAEHRKIGEGGYGPVYKSQLDHTEVAIKVLRPDAAQGRSQFQQEVEVLSCIRHPNMVLLLGACPEYGCLVYEYMANGSLEDRLFRRGNTPALSWQARFRISAEIGTGLLFLHQTKPEPLVHRDLKPANILLDRNLVSKISDVGLARLVPPSVANTVTQYRMTSTAGTFCYIDPEYQQTGMLGIKSDVYSLGVMLLQIITAKSPMGLTHHVERSIEKGTFAQMLDPQVHDWPVEEALVFAKLALKCTELRRKDRPDLGTAVLPELNRLRALAEESMPDFPGALSPRKPSANGNSRSHVIESKKLYSDVDGAKGRSIDGSARERSMEAKTY
ncbi:Protein kinase protein with adenine nucleotide alpha hydrolases-like domain [Striga hermonthica]|uniref:RING-type E3 ubiquitin transferase n=1 Tax=Striga hermonthica TaxID=68872 RepID=A0A9N7MZM3_STRHE|nr:Protein kinase protein with adenine nucleotide alpha hydrolases-like domain [Striga hermonthica]